MRHPVRHTVDLDFPCDAAVSFNWTVAGACTWAAVTAAKDLLQAVSSLRLGEQITEAFSEESLKKMLGLDTGANLPDEAAATRPAVQAVKTHITENITKSVVRFVNKATVPYKKGNKYYRSELLTINLDNGMIIVHAEALWNRSESQGL